MRRFAVGALALCLSLIVVAPAGAATTTASGTYAGETTPLARPGLPPSDCIDFLLPGFTGNPCLFEGTGTMTGTTATSNPWVAGYQAHLQWAPVQGDCAPVSGEVWFAVGVTDFMMRPLTEGHLVAVIDPAASYACQSGGTFTIHLAGTVEGRGVGPYQDAVGTFTRDGTLTFPNAIPGTDSGTFSVTYTVPDPPPPPRPTSAADCAKGHWQSYGIFKNQGDCVSYVATHGKNEPGKNIPK